MKLKPLLSISIISIIFFSIFSCQKDSNGTSFTPNPTLNNDTIWSDTIVKAMPSSSFFQEICTPTFIDSFYYSPTVAYTFNRDSIQISLPANSLIDPNGSGLQGLVKVEVHILKTRGDFIRYDKSNFCVINNNFYLLNPSFGVNVRFYGNGVTYNIVQTKKISIRLKAINPPKDALYFQGTTYRLLNNNLWGWIPTNKSPIFPGSVNIWQDSTNPQKPIGFQISTSNPNWFCVSQFDDPIPPLKNKINVTLPLNYTNKNTVVYGYLNKLKAVFGLVPDKNLRNFSMPTFQLPENAFLVSISKIGNDYYLGNGIANASDTTGKPIQIIPQKIDLAKLKTVLGQL